MKENNLKKLPPLFIKSKKEVILLHPNEKYLKKILTTATAVIKDMDRFPLSREWQRRGIFTPLFIKSKKEVILLHLDEKKFEKF